jgi:hypothetical protein
MLNYTPAVIEEINQIWNLTKGDKPKTAERMMSIARNLDRAEKWMLTEEAVSLIWNTDVSDPAIFETAWLPFRDLVLEYNFPYERLGLPVPKDEGDNRSSAVQRVCWLHDIGDEVWEDICSDIEGWNSSRKHPRFWHPSYNPSTVLTGWGLDSKKRYGVSVFWKGVSPEVESLRPKFRWLFTPYTLIVTSDALANLRDWYLSADNYRYGKQYSSPFLAALVPVDENENMRDDLHPEESHYIRKESIISLMDEVRLSMSLIAILASGKVPFDRIEAPAKLNKKRAKRGRPLIPEYKVLNLTYPKRPSSGMREPGTHSSPRVHVRRGHVRNQWYPSKQAHAPKWIRPAIVGVGEPVKVPTKVIANL